MDDPLLRVEGLSVEFETGAGRVRAVDDLHLELYRGETLAVLGESGSGKSVSASVVMGILESPPGRIVSGRVIFDGEDLLGLPDRVRRALNGKRIAMVFQDALISLNPVYSIGWQIAEVLRVHTGISRRDARERAVSLLTRVGMPNPADRARSYPHQLSGGQRQRVMIAMAIALDPEVLIADEPTTALDVTIQAQILGLLVGLQKERGMALVLITHDMGVVAETAARVMVMYAGQQVEEQSVEALFAAPRHPYTGALLDALPERSIGRRRLSTIPGVVPGIDDRPSGCLFNPRCRFAEERCRAERPMLEADAQGRLVRCHFPLTAPAPVEIEA